MKTLNGRTPSDSLGKPTYHGSNGVSVVDYVILSQALFDIITYFVVDEPNYLSDHSQITAWFSKRSLDFQNSGSAFSGNLKPLPNQFIWEEGSKQRFQEALSSDQSTGLISEFLLTNDKHGVDKALTLFENILMTAAKQSLRLKTRKTRFKKRNCLNKKWFDKDCHIQRVKLRRLSNLKHRDPLNLLIREQYNSCLREYKFLLSQKKDIFQLQILRKFEKENNSEEFWKILRSAKDSFDNVEVPPISETEWLNHFQSLHAVNNENDDWLKEDLKRLEQKSSVNTNLDYPISDQELFSCMQTLKNKKGCGVDKISNEII